MCRRGFGLRRRSTSSWCRRTRFSSARSRRERQQSMRTRSSIKRRPSTGAGAYQDSARHRVHDPDRLLPPFSASGFLHTLSVPTEPECVAQPPPHRPKTAILRAAGADSDPGGGGRGCLAVPRVSLRPDRPPAGSRGRAGRAGKTAQLPQVEDRSRLNILHSHYRWSPITSAGSPPHRALVNLSCCSMWLQC